MADTERDTSDSVPVHDCDVSMQMSQMYGHSEETDVQEEASTSTMISRVRAFGLSYGPVSSGGGALLEYLKKAPSHDGFGILNACAYALLLAVIATAIGRVSGSIAVAHLVTIAVVLLLAGTILH